MLEVVKYKKEKAIAQQVVGTVYMTVQHPSEPPA
jgi:hypothetical protein